MTPGEEHQLHVRDRFSWLEYVKRGMAQKLRDSTDAEALDSWGRMQRDYQTAVWELLSEPERERIKKLRAPQTRKGRA